MTAEKAIEILSGVGDINRCCAEDAEAIDMAIKALEKQPCEDCISRQAVLNMKRLFIDEDGVMAYAVPTGNILRLPSVQPTRPTGKWKKYLNEGGFLDCECSNCGRITNEPDNYCPNCGCRVKGEE